VVVRRTSTLRRHISGMIDLPVLLQCAGHGTLHEADCNNAH
jgi:hypothetical protein